MFLPKGRSLLVFHSLWLKQILWIHLNLSIETLRQNCSSYVTSPELKSGLAHQRG
jgi:hypothetical protein